MPVRGSRWTSGALADLDSAVEYIAEEDGLAAKRIAQSILDAVRHLEDHPGMGRPGRVHDTRERVVTGTPYLVIYRVRGDAIEILRILHGARQWP